MIAPKYEIFNLMERQKGEVGCSQVVYMAEKLLGKIGKT